MLFTVEKSSISGENTAVLLIFPHATAYLNDLRKIILHSMFGSRVVLDADPVLEGTRSRFRTTLLLP